MSLHAKLLFFPEVTCDRFRLRNPVHTGSILNISKCKFLLAFSIKIKWSQNSDIFFLYSSGFSCIFLGYPQPTRVWKKKCSFQVWHLSVTKWVSPHDGSGAPQLWDPFCRDNETTSKKSNCKQRTTRTPPHTGPSSSWPLTMLNFPWAPCF